MDKSNSPFIPVGHLGRLLSSLVQMMRRFQHRIRLRYKLTIGRNNHIGSDCGFRPPDKMRLSDDVAIRQAVTVEANLLVGPSTLISSRVSFVGNDHSFDDPRSAVFWQGRLPASTIVLEGDNLIGAGVIIVGNVRIDRDYAGLKEIYRQALASV